MTGKLLSHRAYHWIAWFLAVLIAALAVLLVASTARGQVSIGEMAPVDRHLPEMQRYLDRLQLSEPVAYRHLRVYSLQLIRGETLTGRWLTLDDALSRGDLVITEKGGGSVPTVQAENRSRDAHVLIMSGEVIKGGKQTRTVREDVILAPGQRVDLSVFCVEERRWQGDEKFAAANTILPQSILQGVRSGADQQQVWAEIDRTNRALGAENPTASLERAMRSPEVERRLEEVRRRIVPEVPRGTVGFIFVAGNRALGADYFGSEYLARQLLPKLLDSYAVDVILQGGGEEAWDRGSHRAAIDLYDRIRRAGSERKGTPGSGAGIRTRAQGLSGDGVSLGGVLVHYGVQTGVRIPPIPRPPQPIIRPDFPQRR